MEQLDLGLQAGLLQTTGVEVSVWVAACFVSGSVRARGASSDLRVTRGLQFSSDVPSHGTFTSIRVP